MLKSCLKWSVFQLEIWKSWCSRRLCISTLTFSHLYQWLITRAYIWCVKLFADNTSLFSIVNCAKASASVLNSDSLKIQDWAYHWKMLFNPDQAKQAQQVIFSRRSALHERCPYLELFWSVFLSIRTEYREILRISPYSVRIRENTDQNNSEYGHFLRSANKINHGRLYFNIATVKLAHTQKL